MIIVDPRWREVDGKIIALVVGASHGQRWKGYKEVHHCHGQVAGLLERDEKIKRENKNS
jgi:hypothetical protein